MKIGVMDSGIGGLTVLKELLKYYPNNHYIYFGDTLNVPYGDKSINELTKFTNKAITFLINLSVDVIIIACGTISSNVYSKIKKKYNIPIIDIISPTINYIKKSNYKNITILGTSRTVDSHIFKSKLSKINVTEISLPKLVPIIEKRKFKTPLGKYLIKKNIKFVDKKDAIVLGCTHYPYVFDIFYNYLKVPIINLGTCLCQKIKLSNKGNKKIDLYFTKLNKKIIKNCKEILKNEEFLNILSA